jgi:GrxC family glutaredoxin
MVKIYTLTMCPSCIAAKRLLKERNIEFEEINIQKEKISRDELEELTGGRTVPQIIINDKSIGGFENLLALDQKSKLLD